MSRALREAGPSLDFNESKRERRVRIAAALGHQAGRMIVAGFVNRDYKASNFIIDTVADRGAEPLLIDLDGLRRLRSGRTGRGQIDRMLTTLYRSVLADGEVLPAEATAFTEAIVEEVPWLAPAERMLPSGGS